MVHLTLCRIALVGVIASAVAAAGAPSCETLNALWSSRYHADFGVQWAKREFRCPDDADYRIAKALHDLYEADPEHRFYDSARELTRRTRYSERCDADTAAWMSPDGVMTLCPAFLTRSEAKRAATVFHEAAHARESDRGHVRCRRGDAEGRIACDEEFTGNYDGGAYNWEVQYAAYVKQHAGDDLTRWAMDAHLKFLLLNRFNLITRDQIRRWSR